MDSNANVDDTKAQARVSFGKLRCPGISSFSELDHARSSLHVDDGDLISRSQCLCSVALHDNLQTPVGQANNDFNSLPGSRQPGDAMTCGSAGKYAHSLPGIVTVASMVIMARDFIADPSAQNQTQWAWI